jgi:S1-C subfamily serine protease
MDGQRIPTRLRSAWARRPTRAQTRRGLRRAAPFASGVIAALVGVWLFVLLNPAPAPLTTTDVQNTVNQTLASQSPAPPDGLAVYQQVRPSLVLIEANEPGQAAGTEGVGSGVLVDAQGDILTALHVVDTATSIKLTFADGTTAAGTVKTRQPQNDIAVVQAVATQLNVPPAVLGNPNAVQVGDEAFVVGNPLGLVGSLTAGVVSGLDRTFTEPTTKAQLKGLIQVDAAVNPGNSGGPLVNRDGQVVGIVTGLVNPTSQNFFIGIGLAVPIDVAGGAAGLPPD